MYRYRGIRPDGVATVGSIHPAKLEPFVRNCHETGWQSLDVTDGWPQPHTTVARIEQIDGERIWWIQTTLIDGDPSTCPPSASAISPTKNASPPAS